jgi:urease accessory protein
MTMAALLLLVDGRFPAGGYAHSGGVEEAVSDGRVHDLATLEAFLLGRLWTVGQSDAAITAAAWAEAAVPRPRWSELDAEATARCPSAVVRRASRSLGRSLLRAASTAWPGPVWAPLRAASPGGPLAPVALGAAARAAGATEHDAALVAAHGAVATPAAAAVRLLGLDPLAVAALSARLAAQVDTVASGACVGDGEWGALPAATAPLIDVGAERHARREVRLFAS